MSFYFSLKSQCHFSLLYAMKHSLILMLCLLCFGSLPLSAQKDLQIGKFFDSSYGKRKDATETLIKGKQLKPYKMTLFRSLTLPIHAVNIAELEKAIKTDTKEAIDKEAGSKGARLYYGFYQLRPIDKTRRYLFFRNNSLNPTTSRQNTLTLIYMQGSATLDELKSKFAK